MLKITFIIPYSDLADTVAKYLSEARLPNIRFDTIHIVGVEDVKKLTFDCDIIVARGITCAALREYHPDISVVEIPVTGYDVIRALDECKRSFGSKKVAVIGAETMIFGAPSLNRILGIEVLCYRIEKETDMEPLVDEALKRGAQAVVGGFMTYNYALAKGIPCTWIKTGPDAIKQAVDEAVRTAFIKGTERERAEFLKIVMDYTHEGILAVDRNGRVTALNKSATAILKRTEKESLGTSLRTVLPSSALLRVLERGEEDLGALETFGETQIAANFVPIKIGTEVTGAVATFQNLSGLQEMEGRIRKKIYSKGHVAKYRFKDILGQGPEILNTIRTAEKYSRVDANVLIIGETGTGKELFAHSIHNASVRAQGAFVAINCAALPEQLLESELFGYAEGAFTGAMKGGKAGLFELAHNGTVFLDEIGELPLGLQAKLLRVLQEHEIMRIGHDRVIPVDVRVIAATNKDLKRKSEEGAFRRDLLFRLDVLRVNVPPLRRRREDIPLLMQHFLLRCGERFGNCLEGVSAEAMRFLVDFPWPGNIRELVNLCERVAALAEKPTVDLADILPMMEEPSEFEEGRETGKGPSDTPARTPLMKDAESEAILSALRRTGNNQTLAADLLGISRTTLWRKLKEQACRDDAPEGRAAARGG